MAPRPAPGMLDQKTTDEIHMFCDKTCEGTANPDFCFDACWKFRKALLMPVPTAASAQTTSNNWQQGGSNSGYWPTASATIGGVFAQSTTQTSYLGAQATGISAASSVLVAISSTLTDSALLSSTSTAAAADTTTDVPPGPHPPHPPPWLIALSVIIPIVIVVLLAGLIVTCIRGKRTRKALAQAKAAAADPEAKGLSEMTERPDRVDAYIRPPSSIPPPAATPSVSLTAGASVIPGLGDNSAPHGDRPSLTNRHSQPVILSNTINGGYFTGIDTADAASIRSQPAGDIYPTHDEEPPPPYRPASVPPISRDSSTRSQGHQPSLFRTITNRTYSRCLTGPERQCSVRTFENVAEEAEDGMRNPFEDPEDESLHSSRDEKYRLTLSGDEPSGSSIRRNSLDDDDTHSMMSHLNWDEPETRNRDGL